MTSARQIAANRQNAQGSTGPRTPAGRARVAQNAITHGLLAQDTLLPDEDEQAYQTFAETVRAEWNPEGAHEHFLVDRMIRAARQLGRVARMEAGVWTWHRLGVLAERPDRSYARGAGSAVSEQDERPEDSPAATLGLTVLRGLSGVDAVSKLHRYEADFERSYFRALHELQRAQHARLGGHVSPPLAIDVMVDDGADVQADRSAAVPVAPQISRRTAAED